MKRTALAAVLLVAAGCTPKEGAPQPPAQTPARTTKPAHGGPSAPACPAMPGQDEADMANVPDEPIDAKVEELQKAYESDTSEARKKELVTALVSNADYYMYKAELPPREKYTKALALYRRALKLDPENETAKDSIQTIEDIYRSMGRPVPEDTSA